MNLKKACFLSLLIVCMLAALAYGRKHHTTLTWDRSANKMSWATTSIVAMTRVRRIPCRW